MRFRPKHSVLLLALCLCLVFAGRAQVGQGKTPEFTGMPRYDLNGQRIETRTSQPPTPVYPYQSVRVGMNANDVMNIARQESHERMYGTQAQTNSPNEDEQFRQYSASMYPLDKEIMDMILEAGRKRQAVKQTQHYQSTPYKIDYSRYQQARDALAAMLSGQRPLSVKDAYFLAEQAYGGVHLDYAEYDALIEQNAEFIRAWLKQHRMDITDPEALHYGIQKFMTDTLSITVNNPEQGGGKTMTHVPYYYDYIDYTGEQDRRNYFVTKTLATGTGQCHTLPVTYLVLAEALGGEVYLSYNPQHSFVRFQNNNGTWINYECTIGQFVPDQFYLDEMPMMAVAHQNGLYVQPLNRRQVVATVLIDLAVSFIEEHWVADGRFIQSCMDPAMAEFPNHTFINTAGHYVNRKMYSAQFNSRALKYGITNFNQVAQYPDVQQAYQWLQEYLAEVERLGIEAYPEQEYLDMIAYHDEKGRLQQSRQVDAKSIKSLFKTTPLAP